MLKKTKTRDFSFNISGPGSVSPSQSPVKKKKREASGDVETVRVKKNKKAEQPARARQTDEPDDADFENDRPRPPKAKRHKRHLAAAAPTAKAAKRPGTALAVVNPLLPNGKPRISRLKHKGMDSILGIDAEALQQMLESGESDSALTQLNRRLIQTSIDLIAEVEVGIRESKGRYGVHSFNGLVQSIRELMIDLQSTQDRGAIGLTLMENIVRPTILEIGMAIMKEYQIMGNDVESLGLPKSNLAEFRTRQVESRTRIGNVLQTKHDEMKASIIQAMQR